MWKDELPAMSSLYGSIQRLMTPFPMKKFALIYIYIYRFRGNPQTQVAFCKVTNPSKNQLPFQGWPPTKVSLSGITPRKSLFSPGLHMPCLFRGGSQQSLSCQGYPSAKVSFSHCRATSQQRLHFLSVEPPPQPRLHMHLFRVAPNKGYQSSAKVIFPQGNLPTKITSFQWKPHPN